MNPLKALDRVAESACKSCGFFDPQALEDDPDLIDKIFEGLNGGKRFVCHDGLPTNNFGQYVPTLEQQLAAPLCAGFAALKAEIAKQGVDFTTSRQKVQLCREILKRGRLAPCIPDRS